MKLLLCSTLLLAAASGLSIRENRISALKKSIQQGSNAEESSLAHMFMFEEGEENVFSIKVSAKATQLPMPANSQLRTWSAISEESPMTKKGYTHWMPTEKGFLFQNKDGSKQSMCQNNGVAALESVVKMSFKCKAVEAAAEPGAAGADEHVDKIDDTDKTENSGTSGGDEQASDNKIDGDKADEAKADPATQMSFKGKKGYPYSSMGMMGGSTYMPINTMSSMYPGQSITNWQPCSNGLPYGWNNYNWPSMGGMGWGGYPYYSVNSMGYYGCPSLTGNGMYCSVNPYYYPFSP